MVFDEELRRGHLFDSVQAGIQIKNAAALTTKKVVVMPLVRPFISRGLTRYFDGNDQPLLGEGLQKTINRCNSQAGNILQGNFLNLGG
jgi:hypothetical protein